MKILIVDVVENMSTRMNVQQNRKFFRVKLEEQVKRAWIECTGFGRAPNKSVCDEGFQRILEWHLRT